MHPDLEVSHDELQLIMCVGEGAHGKVWQGKWKGRGGGIPVAVKKIALGGLSTSQKTLTNEVGILLYLHLILSLSFLYILRFFLFFSFYLTEISNANYAIHTLFRSTGHV